MRVSRLLAFAILFLSPALVSAQVDVIGDVRPADNPFTLSLSEGLQATGATVQVGTIANPPNDPNGNFMDIDGNVGQPFYEQNYNVIIGTNSFGEVSISNEAILRNAHLILGGDADEDPSVLGPDVNTVNPASFSTGAFTNGFGVMRINGFGSTYNNHPLIVPTLFQDPSNIEATRFNIPTAWNFGDLDFDGNDEVFPAGTIDRDETIGFDAYVGLTGAGLLEITAGGRAEIQDAVIVGYGPAASGEVVVSGSGSYLAAYGGINPDSPTSDFTTAPAISQMVVGGFGTGVMRVENGGRVQAFRGAAIGVTASSGDNDDINGGPDSDIDFERGGRGIVSVDGVGSQWDIFVAKDVINSATDNDVTETGLSIGEFVENEDPTSLEPQYPAVFGQGSLTISNGGRVRIIDVEEGDDDGDLRIGRFSELVLASGSIEVQDEIYSDGIIRGDGDILAGRFINRSFGEVRVAGGERLKLRTDDDTGAFPTNVGVADITNGVTPTATITNYYAANFGSIQVIGDEASGVAVFEYERASDTTSTATEEFRFINGLRTNATGSVTSPPAEPGEIIVNNGHLHFRTGQDLTDNTDGLLNLGVLAFVGGDNLVTGTVENGNDPATGPATPGAGEIFINGNDTFVTFADGVFNAGTGLFSANTGAAFVLLPGSAAYSGSGTLRLTGTASGTVAGDFILGDPTSGAGGAIELVATPDGTPTLSIEGDFTMGTNAAVDFSGDLGNSFVAGDMLELISIGGAVNELATNFDDLVLTALPTFSDVDLAATLMVDGDGSLVLEVLSIASSGAVGADFNGDGIVDGDDLDLFSMFFGLEEGATVLTGDANGDGAVDAADFFLLQEQFGGAPVPVVSALVPEPSTGLLLLVGLTVSARRRRS